MTTPLLVLCIDVDNDLYEKAKVRGPVVGREENIKAATSLALADPEESDANTIFEAVKLYDQLCDEEERKVYIATITGHKSRGYVAGREVAKQLDRVIEDTGVGSCIIVTDGRDDEEVLPIIKSRLRIESSKLVVVKQAKELEKTYFVILEKLKDPYYSRIIIGVPALLIFLFSLSTLFGFGWPPIGIILGLYLMAKGFGVDSYVVAAFNEVKFSLKKVSWATYLASFALIAIALLSGSQAFRYHQDVFIKEKAYAYAIKAVLVVMPWALLLLLAGKTLDAVMEHKKLNIIRYGSYAIAILLISMVLDVICVWIINEQPPYITFPEVLVTLFTAIVVGILTSYALKEIKRETILHMDLIGKRVVGDMGSVLGKVVGVDATNEVLVVHTPFDKDIKIEFELINNVDDDVVVSKS